MKYIMFQACLSDGTPLKNIPIIFPSELSHIDVSRCVLPAMRNIFPIVKLKSAGFYDPRTSKAYGRSETMKVDSHPSDSFTIATYNSTHGII